MKSILLVRESPAGSEDVMTLLSSLGYGDIRCVLRDSDIMRHASEIEPDLLFLDIARPDTTLLRNISRIVKGRPCPVIMFVEESDDEVIADVVRAGVSAYVVDGYQQSRVRQIIEIALARFAETQKLKSELDETRKTLGERKKIDRAKGIIMQQKGCNEDDAYKMMRKMAMDKNVKISNIADRILEVSELLH
jgi:response regulator NasT